MLSWGNDESPSFASFSYLSFLSESYRDSDNDDGMARLLSNDDDNDDDSASHDDGTASNSPNYDDSQVLLGTFMVYGSALLLIFVTFCWVRRRFPAVYHTRSWVQDTTGDLTTHSIVEQGSFLSWISRVYAFRDDEILRKCGMDALCFIRIAQFGYRCKC